MRNFLNYIVVVFFLTSGCSAVKETSKYQLQTGIYKVNTYGNRTFYASVKEDRIDLHPVVKLSDGFVADSQITSSIAFNELSTQHPITFTAGSFDLDVVTILFKYRPSTSNFPNQLNTNFNGVGYIGYRSDLYRLSSEKTALNTLQKNISHFGYSLGIFGGLGATFMSPYVTNNSIATEYDGVLITKGIAGLIGIGNLTFGAAIGFDHLLDKNHKQWIYQAKPWIGFTVGLNLN